MRALVSVYNKEGIVDFCKKLQELNVEIISTGGTSKLLTKNGISHLEVSKVTNNKESFGGRMKTISFEIMSSILFRRNNEMDLKEIAELGLTPIDLVVCNLYDFESAVKKNSNEADLIELIDIGGPTMIRSAAKNFNDVTCVIDFKDYDLVANELLHQKKVSLATNKLLAQKAFAHTAAYDLNVANELHKRFNDSLNIVLSESEKSLRYGENPHQTAKLSLYSNTLSQKTLSNAPILQGKEISYNNYLDSDAAYKCMSELFNIFENKKSVVIVKHGTPCGVAVANTMCLALENAWNCDATSAFGGVIAFSEQFDTDCARFFDDKFIEVIIAPAFSESALEMMSKKKNVRLVELSPKRKNDGEKVIRSINGGILIQDEDESLATNLEYKNVTNYNFSKLNTDLLYFGQTIIKYLKSNCLALVKESNGSLVIEASGVGQPNRIDCLTKLIASKIENTNLDKSILFSDAFFPFSDSIIEANKIGVKYIVQPGGSIKDKEVIAKCDELNMAMIFTNSRHFRH
jgi:phosphoribosylaminoimidazolecarboxamide formyltransferase/IMP cyclohydrolase